MITGVDASGLHQRLARRLDNERIGNLTARTNVSLVTVANCPAD
jgi:hypothetical protein